MAGEPTQEQEMALAYKQKRQPFCVYCKKPLDEIRQEQSEDIVWKWDKQLRQYKSTDARPIRTAYKSTRRGKAILKLLEDMGREIS